MTDTVERETLLAAAKGGDAQAKERFAELNFGLVHSIARRFRDRGVPYDDLFQIGCMGLVKAIERYDPDYQTAFSTYAVPVILGELRRFFREDGPVKVSRGMKERAAKLAAAREAYIAEKGCEPTIQQLADRAGLSPEEAAAALQASLPTVSLSAPANEEGGSALEERLGGREEIDMTEQIALRSAVSSLSEREQKIVALRFFAGKTQCETAERIGVTQVQISRLEKKILSSLRERMAE